MTTNYPDLKNEPELLKIKTRDDEIKKLKYQKEKHDHENILKSLKIDDEYYKRKDENMKKRRYCYLSMKYLLVLGLL